MIPRPDAEVCAWVGLRRVCGGQVAELGGRWYRAGRPMVRWLEGPLAELVEIGLITLAEPDLDSSGLRRAAVTARGRARYEALCDKRGTVAYSDGDGW
ncbi:MAG: hypothetical protein ACRDRL_24500 [Sciscionella sp.]